MFSERHRLGNSFEEAARGPQPWQLSTEVSDLLNPPVKVGEGAVTFKRLGANPATLFPAGHRREKKLFEIVPGNIKIGELFTVKLNREI